MAVKVSSSVGITAHVSASSDGRCSTRHTAKQAMTGREKNVVSKQLEQWQRCTAMCGLFPRQYDSAQNNDRASCSTAAREEARFSSALRGPLAVFACVESALWLSGVFLIHPRCFLSPRTRAHCGSLRSLLRCAVLAALGRHLDSLHSAGTHSASHSHTPPRNQLASLAHSHSAMASQTRPEHIAPPDIVGAHSDAQRRRGAGSCESKHLTRCSLCAVTLVLR